MKKLIKRIFLFIEWILASTLGDRKLRTYVKEFPYIWVLLFALLAAAIVAVFSWTASIKVVSIILTLILALVLIRPMNAVYGLMGTSGSIRLFFVNFLLITLLFAGVYYLAFFKDAGISYDVNQPHIDYMLFAPKDNDDTSKVAINDAPRIRVIEKYDTLVFERQIETVYFKESIVQVTTETIHYQPIDFWLVWRSSILTTLTQEPADLLTAATVFNDGMESSNVIMDKQKSVYFEWILIFHIVISWIFFGMFISLLYNKFRYES